jgi:hypothetical protein
MNSRNFRALSPRVRGNLAPDISEAYALIGEKDEASLSL